MKLDHALSIQTYRHPVTKVDFFMKQKATDAF